MNFGRWGSFFYLWRKTHAGGFSCLSTDFFLVTLMIFAAVTEGAEYFPDLIKGRLKGPGREKARHWMVIFTILSSRRRSLQLFWLDGVAIA
jgi:hypothetical protein